MEHEMTLITTLAAGFGLALIFGFIAERIKVPALVGYLFAGIIIGPSTHGFVADVSIASQLSEIGVMLLMFGVGLHFSLKDLLAVKRIALPGAVVQMGLATALGMIMAMWWGWSVGPALVFGMSLSCASTVVLLKALEARGVLDSMNGRIAVGWLVVEDLVTVLFLVLMPPLASVLGGTPSAAAAEAVRPLWQLIGITLLQVSAFVVLMLVLGRRLLPWLLWQVVRTGSRELFTLAVVAAAIGIAYGAAELFSVSFALGAFFAGMMMRESEFSHRAAHESLPLRDAFAVLFFVAVGMLFEPHVLIDEPWHVLGVVAIIVLGKSLVAFALITPISNWALKHSSVARRLSQREDPYAELPMNTERKYLEGQVVLVGYGRIGQRIAQAMKADGIPYVVAEQNRECVEDLRKQGVAAVYGDAVDPMVLAQAHIANAAMLVVATPDAIDVHQIVTIARTLNPDIEIVVRSHNEEESQLLQKEGVNVVFYGEEELAKSMTGYVLERVVHHEPLQPLAS